MQHEKEHKATSQEPKRETQHKEQPEAPAVPRIQSRKHIQGTPEGPRKQGKPTRTPPKTIDWRKEA